MGVKDLWPILAPYSEKKSLFELEGKIVAIDLACWVCEAQTVVDYYIQPKFYLRNLYFRTCHLLMMGINPVFVLEGKAPELKYDTISQRNIIQFKGSRPKTDGVKTSKDRRRFNIILSHCEKMLKFMGLKCMKGLGEAEATCAYLNADGIVNGCITQDSDCFLYGASTVYRNFSITKQSCSGSIDVYELNKFQESIDFGRNKMIALALLSGCDYDNSGVHGVGRDSAVKLLNQFKDSEILERLESWRTNQEYFEKIEREMNDPNICTSCGHIGKIQKHSRSGCSNCGTTKGCDTKYREKRILIKNELQIRSKSLENNNFPNKDIINEYLIRKDNKYDFDSKWEMPDVVHFIEFMVKMLDWEEIYAFEKILPLLTRWSVLNHNILMECSFERKNPTIVPNFIKKTRNLKGIKYYEIVWKDPKYDYLSLIPKEQIENVKQNCKTENIYEVIWATNEPIDLIEKVYPKLVEDYLETKKKKPIKKKKGVKLKAETNLYEQLNNLSIDENLKPKKRKVTKLKNDKKVDEKLPKIDNYFNKIVEQNFDNFVKKEDENILGSSFSDSFVEISSDEDSEFNLSKIVDEITENKKESYENSSIESEEKFFSNHSNDVEDLFEITFNQTTKINLVSSSEEESETENCEIPANDSFFIDDTPLFKKIGIDF